MKKHVKTMAANNGKKVGALLALLLAGNVAKGAAEEVTGTILFPPEESFFGGEPEYTYYLDTDDNKIADKTLTMSQYLMVPSYTKLLKLYLTPGSKVTLELNNPSKKTSSVKMLVEILTASGVPLDFTEMFSMDGISYYFPYLYEKLVREGKAR